MAHSTLVLVGGTAHAPASCIGAAFPAFEMEAYRNVSSEDFPRTEAGDLAGTVHPQLQGCVCVCVLWGVHS